MAVVAALAGITQLAAAPASAIIGKPGFFHVEQRNGKWVVIDPAGKPFHMRGANHYSNGTRMPWNLKERYANDKEKLNKEIMELYRRNGVNPLGGCLPMVLQMPVFFALWSMLNTNVDIRHQPFMWWMKDLTSPDALFTVPEFRIPLISGMMGGPMMGLPQASLDAPVIKGTSGLLALTRDEVPARRAGTPTISAKSGTSRLTTAPAPTTPRMPPSSSRGTTATALPGAPTGSVAAPASRCFWPCGWPSCSSLSFLIRKSRSASDLWGNTLKRMMYCMRFLLELAARPASDHDLAAAHSVIRYSPLRLTT